MELVIDTNIIFSALLDKRAREFNIITLGSIDIFVCLFSTVEIFKHKEKLQKFSGLTEQELLDNYYLLLKHLQIIHENDISRESWQEASELCADVDPKDTVYIAASMMLGADLWTGDKKLIKGLKKKGYEKTITTAELMASL